MVWFVSNVFLNFVSIAASDSLVSLSNEILLMVNGSCFNQFTPNKGVILIHLVIKSDSLVCVLLSLISTHTFPRNLISIFLTSWYLSFSGRISSGLYSVGLFGMKVTNEPVSMINFCFFPVYCDFDAVVVIVVRYYVVDLCDLEYSFGFTFFVVFFRSHFFQYS